MKQEIIVTLKRIDCKEKTLSSADIIQQLKFFQNLHGEDNISVNLEVSDNGKEDLFVTAYIRLKRLETDIEYTNRVKREKLLAEREREREIRYLEYLKEKYKDLIF